MTSLFGHSVRSELLLLYLAEALACFLAVYLLLTWYAALPMEEGGPVAVTVALACGIISGACGLYRPEVLARARELLLATLVAGLLLLLALPLVAVANPAAAPGLQSHLLGVMLAFFATVVTTRLVFAGLSRSGALRRRLAILRGADGASIDLSRLNADARDGRFDLAFTLPAEAAAGSALDPARLRAARVWAIVLAAGAAPLPDALRRRCEQEAGVQVLGEAEFLERQFARIDVEHLPEGWLAASRAAHPGPLEAALRRGLDLLLGSLLLLATLPLLLLTALAIKLDSRGPVFYRQERVGRDGKVFMLLKFRSMVDRAEAAGSPVWASLRDPRVTRIGRLIRLLRIDEIPQVLNVLRGDMAFVGPRPERPAFVEQLGRAIPHYHDRARVKPGITGWAQVNYPYGSSVEDARMKLSYDLYYVRRGSLFLDLLILIATVRVVLFQEGSR